IDATEQLIGLRPATLSESGTSHRRLLVELKSRIQKRRPLPCPCQERLSMLNIGQKKVPLCSGFSRRSFLQAGTLGTLGLSLPQLLRQEARGAESSGGASHSLGNAIVLFLVGGPSHLDTWDPKPEAPKEVRSIYDVIETS